MGRVSLYCHTVKNLKPSQVFNRLRIKMGNGCSLGVRPSDNYANIQKVESPESLDFDPVFLARPYEKLEFDLMYINDMSILTDLELMFATVGILFSSESTAGVAEGAVTAMSYDSVNDIRSGA